MNQVGIDVSNDVFDATMQHGSTVLRNQFSNSWNQFIRNFNENMGRIFPSSCR